MFITYEGQTKPTDNVHDLVQAIIETHASQGLHVRSIGLTQKEAHELAAIVSENTGKVMEPVEILAFIEADNFIFEGVSISIVEDVEEDYRIGYKDVTGSLDNTYWKYAICTYPISNTFRFRLC